MKTLKLMLLAVILPFVLISCGDDDDDNPSGTGTPDTESATYEFYIDGSKVKSGTNGAPGMLKDNTGKYNAISVHEVPDSESFGIILSGIPLPVGEITNLDSATSSVSMVGKNLLKDTGSSEVYLAMSGFIKRVSDTKFEFEGTFMDMTTVTSHTFKGFIESDAYEIVK